jgi:ubiquinone/menaquinone biosynthesis C-methylase UbiE
VRERRYALEPDIPELVHFPRWRDKDVLEAGCGIATDGAELIRAGARYTGLDFSPTALDLAGQRLESEGLAATLVEGTVTKLPFPDESFDLVYSNGVIHHIPDTEQAVSEFHRVLRPGGTAIVMLYHRSSFNYHFTIMVLRRLLAPLLAIPGGVTAVSRLTGERRDVLESHRRLLREHRIRYLMDRQLFLSHNTDGPGNPLSKVYTHRSAARLFSGFDSVDVQIRFLNLRVYPLGARLGRTALARFAERRWGWHLWVEATKVR